MSYSKYIHLLLLAPLSIGTACISNARVNVHMINEIGSPLDGDAIRTLLHNAFATRPLDPNVREDHPQGEAFLSNGRYRLYRGRSSIEGTFVIRGNLVCVEGRGVVNRCRRIIRNNSDTYLFVDSETQESAVMQIIYPPM